MQKHLNKIALIQTGLFAKPSELGDTVYLQAKHFDENGHLDAELFPDLRSEDISEKHLLRPGDVLFAAKGIKNFASVYTKENPKAAASTSFFVIRLTSNDIIPEYLAWFLNLSNTLSFLKAQAVGTSMPSISKQVLGNLKVNIPNIKRQKMIIKIANLYRKEMRLRQEIGYLRGVEIQQRLTEVMNEK